MSFIKVGEKKEKIKERENTNPYHINTASLAATAFTH